MSQTPVSQIAKSLDAPEVAMVKRLFERGMMILNSVLERFHSAEEE